MTDAKADDALPNIIHTRKQLQQDDYLSTKQNLRVIANMFSPALSKA